MCEGTVEGLAFGGEGIVRLDQFVVFVPMTAPGDTVAIRLTEVKSSYGRGELERVISPSEHRIEPHCPIYSECGGCQLQHVDERSALEQKSKILEGLLRHQLRLTEPPIEPPLPSPASYAYRNKMQVAVGAGHDGKIAMGLYRHSTHDIADMPSCPIQEETNDKLLHAFRVAMEKTGWKPYDERTGAGLVRHFLARVNRKGEAYALIVAAKPALPGWESALDALKSAVPSLQGLAVNVNGTATNVVLGEETRVLWGSDYLEETIGEFRFRFSPASFFQVNSLILPALIDKASEWARLSVSDKVLDLYCGVGTFSIPFGKIAWRVTGIEESAESIRRAGENAALNGITGAEFIVGKVEEQIAAFRPDEFKLIFLDPPRKGMTPEALQGVIRLNPERILYLSCNPPTLVRDLKTLRESGWSIRKAMAADLFPQTAQIEALALLERTDSLLR